MRKNKKLLLFDWQGQSQLDLQEGLEHMPDCEMVLFTASLKNYEEDAEFEELFCQKIISNEIHICFSFNYFPIVSKICQEQDVLYVSWIYDCPHTTLYSKTVHNSCNLIFTFDYLQMEEFRKRGIHHIFHMPLAVNVQRLEKLINSSDSVEQGKKYFSEISFVGSIYEDNYYEQISYLPLQLKGYIDGICASQLQIPDSDFLGKLLSEPVLEELQKYVKLSMGDNYEVSYKKLFLDIFLKKYISSRERKKLLTALSGKYQTALYSGSQWNTQGLECRGIVSYMEQMPQVFYHSLLNLNVTIRSITSGIPLRCLDIMGAGGTLLSNYQPELEEYFEMDKEWICFRCEEELMEKAAFYLRREDLRKEIARKGLEKTKQQFTYEQALGKMFRIIEDYI